MRLRGLPALLACVLVLCAPMSAAAQARVKVVHSIQLAERVASSRHSPDGLRSRATQASCEQAL